MLPFLSDLPPLWQERVVCSISAAIKYDIPANIVLAIAEKEGGRPKQWVRNTNGTYDIGTMQFNTAYLRNLAQYGIRPSDVAAAGCYAYDLAAWRIRGHILNDSGDIWQRVANYHSRTPRFNSIYRSDLVIKAWRWANWLDKHFVTKDVSKDIAKRKIDRSDMPTFMQRTQKQRKITIATNSSSEYRYVPRRITFGP